MLMVSQLLARKDDAGTRTVATVSSDMTVLEAARMMNDQHIGSLVVTGEGGAVEGIITERDFLRRVIAAERVPSETSVREVMTEDVLTCTPDTRINEIRTLMHEKRIRHMPIVEGGRLVGMISIGDLNYAESIMLNEHVEQLESYIRTA